MSEPALKIVDGLKLDDERRALFRPGETWQEGAGRAHILPRFFYEIESWEQAKRTQLSAHFSLAEMTAVDCRESALLLENFPHYAPCAVSILCHYLEAFRQRVDAPVFVCANGGYCSPAHRIFRAANCHAWGSAANIYRIGDTFLDNQNAIEKYGRIAASIAPEVHAHPFGHAENETDDHLHFDIGYVTYVPREIDEAK